MARHRKLTQKFAGFPIFKVGTSGDTFPITSPFTTGFTGYGDGLSLDLQFATDKTLTARKGPTPVFTRASTATFVGSNGLIQSAAINAARFDHDPVTLACKGLLIEESRTNLILRSENFANASWVKAGGSISSVANVAPDGNAYSELFSEDGTTGAHRIFQAFAGTIGTVYTLSVFLKFNGRAEVSLENRSITGNPFAVFNIQNGTVGFVSAGLTAAIQAYPNGWYRCSITGTATLAGGNYLINGYSGSATYTGLNGPAFYIYGSQVEAGAFPTSYTPTVASTVVRGADVCSITGSDFAGFYNQSEGSFYTESRPNTVNGTTTVFGVSNGTANERFLNRFAQNEQVTITSAGVESAFDALNPVAGTLYKVAAAAKLNDMAMSINGLSVLTDTSQPMPTVDRATIGSASSTVVSIRYYKKRLTNAKLQTLTDSYDYTTSGGDFYVKSSQGRYSYR
jgi:hypothetical protein